MGLDQLERLMWWGAGICFLLMGVLIVGEVRAVATGMTDNGRRLGLIHAGVRTLHAGMENLKEENRRQTEVLIEIRDRL